MQTFKMLKGNEFIICDKNTDLKPFFAAGYELEGKKCNITRVNAAAIKAAKQPKQPKASKGARG